MKRITVSALTLGMILLLAGCLGSAAQNSAMSSSPSTILQLEAQANSTSSSELGFDSLADMINENEIVSVLPVGGKAPYFVEASPCLVATQCASLNPRCAKKDAQGNLTDYFSLTELQQLLYFRNGSEAVLRAPTKSNWSAAPVVGSCILSIDVTVTDSDGKEFTQTVEILKH